MAQTRAGSLVEALANIAVGFAINWAANMLILPMFGFHVTGAQAFHMGVLFTAISLVRSYVLRRWFNGLRFGHTPAESTVAVVEIDAAEAVQAVRREMARQRGGAA
jgi:hypothetical protein